MERRSAGPRLKWHRYGAAYYIAWTDEAGRSRERSTGTSSLEEAQEIFGDWLLDRKPAAISGQRDPTETLVTDVLADYALAKVDKVVGKETLANAVSALTRLWEGKTAAEIPGYVATYIRRRNRAPGTMRRELGVLQAAINYCHKQGRLTRSVSGRAARGGAGQG